MFPSNNACLDQYSTHIVHFLFYILTRTMLTNQVVYLISLMNPSSCNSFTCLSISSSLLGAIFILLWHIGFIDGFTANLWQKRFGSMHGISIDFHTSTSVLSLRNEDDISMLSLSKSTPMDFICSSAFSIKRFWQLSSGSTVSCPLSYIFSTINLCRHYLRVCFSPGFIIHFIPFV